MSNKVFIWNNIICPMIEAVGFTAIIMGYFWAISAIFELLGL